jgi:DNA-directed RNA polymerase subunit RPC12/RpoP
MFKQKLARFMYGRYGSDAFSRFLSIASLILYLIGSFISGTAGTVLRVAAIAGIVAVYFRIFSRNTAKRYAENAKYLQIKNRITASFRRGGRPAQRNAYAYFECAQCKTMTRVPKGKGKIVITCPKCGNKFMANS